MGSCNEPIVTMYRYWLFVAVIAVISTPASAIPPANDVCSQAGTVIVNAPFFTSNNVDAGNDFVCGDSNVVANGVFYSFGGTGNVMTVSTCGSSTNFPTEITVSETCGGKCIANQDPGFPVICSDSKGNGKTITFDSVTGVTYRAMVSGRSLLDSGVFNFNVTDRPAPINDVCDDAERLFVTGKDNKVFKAGSTLFATKDSRCNTGVGRGVWYTFMGTGNPMTVSTCRTESDFPHNLYIQTACSGSIACTPTGSPDFVEKCGTVNGRSVTFDSVKEQAYYVIVEGMTTKRTGKFDIAVWDYPTAAFDVCDVVPALLVVNSPTLYTGSTNYAKLDTVNCAGIQVTGRGVWHIFAGTGKVTTVSTCYPATNFPSEILVIQECNNMGVCVTNMDPGVPVPCPDAFGQTLTFDAKISQRYRVMVYGSNTQTTGDYGITVKDYQPPANDICNNAAGLMSDGTPVSGSNVYATLDTITCPNQVVARGVWYVFRGNGRTMTISTCFAQTNYPTELYVFEGCGGACVPTKTSAAKCPGSFGKIFTVDTNANIFYRVLVEGTSPTVVGNHNIALTEFAIPPNDLCTGPKLLIVDDNTISTGTTLGASNEFNCFQNVTERGVWFVVAGNNKQITVSTCAPQTDFAANIDVQQSCAKNCVPYTRKNGCPQNGLATEVTIQSFTGYSYYFRVSAPVTGNYGIRAFTVLSPTPTPPPPTPPTSTPRSCPATDACTTISGSSGKRVNFRSGTRCVVYCTRFDTIKLNLPGFSCGPC